MHPHKFFNAVTFVQSTWVGDVVDEHVTAQLKDVHPTQIVGKVNIPIFVVNYAYDTSRGRTRKGEKFVFTAAEHQDNFLEVEMMFNDEIERFNKSHPHRALSNVQILDIKPMGQAQLIIGQ